MISRYKDIVPVRWLCNWTGVSKSSWYYTPKEGKRGARPTTHTYRLNGKKVSNTTVVSDIKTILGQEHICYGYEKVTWELHDLDYIINKKKVYRLMKEAHLLNSYPRMADDSSSSTELSRLLIRSNTL